MASTNGFPAPPLVLALNTDSIKNVSYVSLGYPDKPATPPSPKDLSFLGDAPLSVEIVSDSYRDYSNFQAGDQIQLNLVGYAADGSWIAWTGVYVAKPGFNLHAFYVPSSIIKSLAGCVAKVGYDVFPKYPTPSNKCRSSFPVSFEIRGLHLPPPVMVEAIGDTIDPDHISTKAAMSYVTIAVDYPNMAIGDTIKLIRKGIDANQKAYSYVDNDRPVSASNLSKRPMTITWKDVELKQLVNGVVILQYKVYRAGIWYTSPEQIIKVGPSLAGLPPFINEVEEDRLDPDTIVDSINVHIPSAGTIVGDKVTLYWSDTSDQNTFTDEGIVTQQNVDGDMSFDIYLDDPITFNIGKMVTVFYTLERVMTGGKTAIFRSGDYQFFVGSLQDQQAAESRELAAPTISGMSGGVLDPASISVGVNITVPCVETQVGDSVTVYWQSTDGGAPTVIGTHLVDANTVNFDLASTATTQIANDAANKGVVVYYTIARKGLGGQSQLFRSHEVPFSVGPLKPSALLAAPIVPFVRNGVLDPMVAQSGLIVSVAPYPAIAVGDKIKLVWLGKAEGAMPAIPEQTVTDVCATLTFVIPVSAIGLSMGTKVWVYYQMTCSGASKPTESMDTIVEVDTPGQDDLAAPVIDPSPDLSVANEDFVVTIRKWPFITAGQRVWLRLEGTGANGLPLVLEPWTSRPLTEQEVMGDLKAVIARAELDKFQDRSELRVRFKVTYDGYFSGEFAEEFPVLITGIRRT